jgi:hypothetical protein
MTMFTPKEFDKPVTPYEELILEGMKLASAEDYEESPGAILVATNDDSDLAEFFFAEEFTVSQSRRSAFAAAKLLVGAPALVSVLQEMLSDGYLSIHTIDLAREALTAAGAPIIKEK